MLRSRPAALTAGALVAAPVALLYELMLGAIAGAWLVRADPAANRLPLALLFVALIPARAASEALHIPVFPLVALALFALVLWRAWQEMTGARSQTAGAA